MLELKHIAKTYKTAKGVKTEALKDINLRFPQRGMVFVLGKSGSGKSTLLNIIGGLDQADAREIIINGKSAAAAAEGSIPCGHRRNAEATGAERLCGKISE